MHRRYRFIMLAFVPLLLAGCATGTGYPDNQALTQQVAMVETAFAQTMADRDLAAFATFLSSEAVFLSGPSTLRGKAEVTASWKRYFDGEAAPFSWQPETVEVLESGKLALSTGPVKTPDGKQVAIFTSIWRQEEPGVWRIVFDRGTEFCGVN